MSQEHETGSVESVTGRVRPQLDLFVGLFLVILGVVVIYESWRMPGVDHPRVRAVYEGPGFVPGLLGITIALFGAMIVIRSIREGGLHLGGAGGQIAAVFSRPEPRRLGLLLLLTVGYAWGLIGRVSFPMATFPFVLAFILVYDWSHTVDRAQEDRWPAKWAKRSLGIEMEWSVFKERVLLFITAAVQAALTAWAVTYVFENIFLRRLP